MKFSKICKRAPLLAGAKNYTVKIHTIRINQMDVVKGHGTNKSTMLQALFYIFKTSLSLQATYSTYNAELYAY